MGQSAQEENWLAHLTYALEYGALLMDLNIDRLALRCFNTALERPAKDEEEEVALAPVRQHALLLKAICLLNEAADAQAEITECLEKWVVAAHGGSDLELKERLLQLQEQSADAAVAVGLLYLLEAKAEVVPCFAGALLAEQGYFGQRPSTRWNMLGAVLSMTGKPELAVRAYRQALQCQPHYPRALINMSASQLKCGGFLEACSSQAQALKVLPFWAAEETWTSLEKEVMAQSTVDDLAEAVKGRHIAKARELLEPYAQDLQNSDLPSEPRQALKEMELIK
ncbi:unnamed protein product [Effrenium voratum]|nr:unnamed protein product [Effrenium voratum]